jgi:RNA polymerase sigma factor (sigma-70 family)
MTTAEFNTCVDQYADGVYRFVLKNIRDEDEAKDIVQDTFEKVWLKVSEISGDKAKSYLFSAAYHTLIDRTRRMKKTTSLQGLRKIEPAAEMPSPDLKKILNQALNTLPEIQRTLILLRDYEGYSYDEIGEITNLNESQVKVYIYRARVALKDYIVKLENVV